MQRRFSPIKWVAVAAMIVTIAAVACFVWTMIGKGGEPASTEASASTTSSSKASQPVDDDIADNPTNEVSSVDAKNAAKALKIVDSGWSMGNDGYVYYGIALQNTSSEFDIEFPAFKITGYASDGSILFNEEAVLFNICAGETLYWGSLASGSDGARPSRVEFKPIAPEKYNISRAIDNPPRYEISGINEVNSEWKSVITGTVHLREGDAGESNEILVTAILRDADGKIVYGFNGHVSGTAQDDEEPFSIDINDAPAHASVEVYAQSW